MKHNGNAAIAKKYRNGFEPTFHPDTFDQPEKWKKPQRIFVGSMGDLFDPMLWGELGCQLYFGQIFDVMINNPQHTFMLLTKQPEIMMHEIDNQCNERKIKNLPQNIYVGVSVTNQADANRMIPLLICVKARTHFVSIEPMLGLIDLDIIPMPRVFGQNIKKEFIPLKINYLDWVICGGQTGQSARPMHPDWVRSLRDQCKENNIPFFFKGWGDFINTNNLILKFSDWRQKRTVLVTDQNVSIDGTNPKSSSDLIKCKYPVAIMSKKKRGTHPRELDGVEYNQFPKTTPA